MKMGAYIDRSVTLVLEPHREETRDAPAPRQRAALDFIREFIAREEMSPTLREIAAGIGITSTNGVTDLLNALQRKGWISRRPLISRSIRVLPEPAPTTSKRSP